MNRAHAHTVAVLRVLRAIGPLPRRRGRMPRQQQPDHLRREYWRAIMPFLAPSKNAFEVVRAEVLRQLADLRMRTGKMDIAEKDLALHLIRRAAARAAEIFSPVDVSRVAEKFGKRTVDFQKAQLSRQLVAAIGVPFAALEKPARDLVPSFAKENTELIKTVPDRYWDRIAKATEEAFESGMRPETLAESFADIDGMADRDALRIARDQIGKLNGEVNQERQEAIGITRFIWRTSKDNRVREAHAELDGETFEWSDPPSDDGEEITPGSAINCRCYAEPDLSDIISIQ